MKKALTLLAAAVLGVAVVGCDEKENHSEFDVLTMRKQYRYDTQTTSNFFANGMSSQPSVEHTVSTVAESPRPPVTPQLMVRGQERFQIYCSMCHGGDGYGNGMVVQRGFPPPPSFHSDRLRGLNDDYLNHVITAGLGKMPPYADQIPSDDRWAIVAYVRALQRSQHATLADVPSDQAPALQAANPSAATQGASPQ